MASAWEAVRRDARRSPRYKLRLMASVSIEEHTGDCQPQSVLTYTRDISWSGLCLIMPAAGLGLEALPKGTYDMRIILALTTGARIALRGESQYILPYKAGDHGRECMVGVRLNQSDTLGIYREFSLAVLATLGPSSNVNRISRIPFFAP